MLPGFIHMNKFAIGYRGANNRNILTGLLLQVKHLIRCEM